MAKYIIELDDGREIKNIGIKDMSFLSGKLIVNEESMFKLTPYEEPEQEKPKRWRAEKGENYWCLDSCGEAIKNTDDYWIGDKWRYESGNYFKTKEEAEYYKESLIVYNKLKAYAEPEDAVWDKYIGHWHVGWDANKQDIYIESASIYKHAELYFPTKKAAQAAIKAVGEEKIKRYYLGIKED